MDGVIKRERIRKGPVHTTKAICHNDFILWRYLPENHGLDWRIHRNELLLNFKELLSRHDNDIKWRAKNMLRDFMADWSMADNEAEMLRIIAMICMFCMQPRSNDFRDELAKLLKII